jgi:glycosyltransferase involved in cell wall biosynthesis
MEQSKPRVSIGLAVYNGDIYLEQSISSILAQTYQGFELIISDNASTDQTEAICRKFAAQDARIRYSRNASNIGGANNHNRTIALARGEYFRWAAHDDVCEPTLIEKCVAVLDRNPDVVLCYSQVIAIDSHGAQGGLTSRNNGGSSKPYARFAAIASARDFCEETYGVVRTSVLRKTQLQQNYTGSDRTLLCELSLYGRFYEVPEPLFFKRFHPGNVYIDWRARMAWFDDKNAGKIVFPFWLQLFHYFVVIARARVKTYVRLRCYLYMLKWICLKWGNLTKDLWVALLMALRGSAWRQQRYADTHNWS